MTLSLRYKEPTGETSRLLTWPVRDRALALGQASDDFRFAAAVAEFGMLLRQSPHAGRATLTDALDLALDARGNDPGGYRAEFVELVRTAARLRTLEGLPGRRR
jgi:Ca-activated chloride channel family protein